MKWLGKISFGGRPLYVDSGLITSVEVDTMLTTLSGALKNDFNTHTDILNIHRELDDTISGTENLWSASKIINYADTIPGTGGGGLLWEVISSNTDAINGHGYLINASDNNVTLKLPGIPIVGDSVGVCDTYNKATTNIITVARNGNNIEGATENLALDVNGSGFTLVYVDSTRGWEIVSEVGSAGVADGISTPIIETPTNISPSNGSTDISPTCTLTATGFYSLYGKSQTDSQFQVSTVIDFSTTVIDVTNGVNTSYVISPAIETFTKHYWRCRYKDVDNIWSSWSNTTEFTTYDIYIQTPTNVSPANGATEIGETPTLSADTFVCVSGTDTHASSDWQISTVDTFASTVWQSLTDTSNLESVTVAAGNLVVSTEYYWRCKYTGTTYSGSSWSTGTSFTTAASFSLSTIGTPGTQGFGVGVCDSLPAGMSSMTGSDDVASDNYGNYQYSDGSIMCWIPKFYYRIAHASNPTYGDYGVNSVDIKNSSEFADTAAANTAGYALHRAFIDGGSEQDGFFVDKYLCSNNSGTASSILNGNPLSSSASHNPFSGLTGTPANYYYGAIDAAKTRGSSFFCTTKFIYSALSILSLAHGQSASATTYCAWYDATYNFPKGCNNNALKDYDEVTNGAGSGDDLLYVTDGYPNCGKTGSGTPFAKCTHNGQACGIADVNGLMYEINLGLVRSGTTDSESINDNLGTTKFYVLKESVSAKDLTSGWTTGAGTAGSTAWGDAAYLEGATTPYDLLDLPMIGKSTGSVYFGNSTNQVLDAATSGAGWLRTGSGIYLDAGSSVTGTNLFGKDRLYEYHRSNLCVVSCGCWGSTSNAGVWYVDLIYYRTYSASGVGLRLACYPV